MEAKFSVIKYLNMNTLIHRLDPRVKFLSFLLILITIFLPLGMTGVIFSFAITTALIMLARIRKIVFIRTLIFTSILMSFIYLINTLTIDPPAKGAWLATIYLVKTWNLLLLSTLFTSTSKESEIVYSINWFLLPLKLIKIPTEQISLIISLGLRFVPNIFLDASTILNTQSLRGLDIKSNNIFEKFKSLFNMFTPLLITSFKRADEISNSLISKGYVIGKSRSQYITYDFSLRDLLFTLIVVTFFSFMIFLMIDNWNYIPQFADNWTIGKW